MTLANEDTDSMETSSSYGELEQGNGGMGPVFGNLGPLTDNQIPPASHHWSEAGFAFGVPTPPPSPSYVSISLGDPAYHTWDNDRRCHRYSRDKSPYYLPDDKAEQDRMDLLHFLWISTLGGKLCMAPIEDPCHVLDVGTGTGRWAIDFADTYQATSVTGTDLSPIQPNTVPENVQFEIVDCLETWNFISVIG